MSSLQNCVLVHVLKDQVNDKINLNKSSLCDTMQYVCIDDIVEARDFEEVNNFKTIKLILN